MLGLDHPNRQGTTPEKQTVMDQRRSAATVATTVTKPSDGARRIWTTLECRPSLRRVTDGPGRLAHSYGSVLTQASASCPLYARSACGIALAGTGRSSQAHLLRRSALPAAVFTALDCPPCGHRVLDRSARRRFVMISPAWTRHPLATDRRPSGGRERTEPAAPRIQGHRAGVMPGVPVAGETGVMRGTLQAREAKCRD